MAARAMLGARGFGISPSSIWLGTPSTVSKRERRRRGGDGTSASTTDGRTNDGGSWQVATFTAREGRRSFSSTTEKGGGQSVRESDRRKSETRRQLFHYLT